MTKHYQEGHGDKTIEYVEMGFCKSRTTKKGPPFGEPF